MHVSRAVGGREMSNPETAMDLLRFMVTVEKWVKTGDPRAEPFLEVDAVRYQNGELVFHKDRFLETAEKFLVS